MKLTDEQFSVIWEKVEEIRFKLQSLKEETHKQPLFSAPDPYEILNALSEFMRSDLDDLIRQAEDAQEVLEAIDDEEEDES